MKKLISACLTFVVTFTVFAPFQAFAVGEFEKGMVSLSFDDGTQSIYNAIAPVALGGQNLLDGFLSTQFIISGAMECAQGGVGCPSFMSADEVNNLSAAGHEIAAHTRTDPCAPADSCSTGVGLTGMPQEELQFEVDGLRQDLLQSIGAPANVFAYPFGEFDDPLEAKLKSAGFVGGRTVNLIDEFGQVLLNDMTTDRYKLFAGQVNGNTPITPTDPDPDDFGSVEEWIDEAIAQDKWLILVFHEIIADCPTNGFCTTPENLTTIVSYLQDKVSTDEVEVVTVGEGLSRMNNHPVSDGAAPV